MCLHVWHLGRQQGNEPALVRDSKASEECTRISLRFRSHRYDTSGGLGKILHASGSEDKILKLSSKIRLVLTLNGLYINTNGTLVLVLSLWLVGVDVRSEKRVVGTFLRSLLTSSSG